LFTRKAATFAEPLAILDPADTTWQHRLALSRGAIGTRTDRKEDRISFLESARSIRERMVASDPGNKSFRSSLGLVYQRLGFVLAPTSGALELFKKSKTIFEDLADAEPTNADWLWHLANAHEHIGRFFEAVGEKRLAVTSLLEALTLREKLIELDSNNIRWQTDLSSLLNALLDTVLLSDTPSRVQLMRALDIMGRLNDMGKLKEGHRAGMKRVEEALGRASD
jgi:tetratricopeptide (TPR) repeat protein